MKNLRSSTCLFPELLPWSRRSWPSRKYEFCVEWQDEISLGNVRSSALLFSQPYCCQWLFLYQRETTDTSQNSDLVVCQRNLAAARSGSVPLPAAASHFEFRWSAWVSLNPSHCHAHGNKKEKCARLASFLYKNKMSIWNNKFNKKQWKTWPTHRVRRKHLI